MGSVCYWCMFLVLFYAEIVVIVPKSQDVWGDDCREVNENNNICKQKGKDIEELEKKIVTTNVII